MSFSSSPNGNLHQVLTHPDLLDSIFCHVPNNSVFPLLTVCKAWYRPALRRLLGDVQIDSPHKLQKFCRCYGIKESCLAPCNNNNISNNNSNSTNSSDEHYCKISSKHNVTGITITRASCQLCHNIDKHFPNLKRLSFTPDSTQRYGLHPIIKSLPALHNLNKLYLVGREGRILRTFNHRQMLVSRENEIQELAQEQVSLLLHNDLEKNVQQDGIRGETNLLLSTLSTSPLDQLPPQLTSLHLISCPDLSDIILHLFLKSQIASSLTDLKICKCRNLTMASLDAIAASPAPLRRLSLEYLPCLDRLPQYYHYIYHDQNIDPNDSETITAAINSSVNNIDFSSSSSSTPPPPPLEKHSMLRLAQSHYKTLQTLIINNVNLGNLAPDVFEPFEISPSLHSLTFAHLKSIYPHHLKSFKTCISLSLSGCPNVDFIPTQSLKNLKTFRLLGEGITLGNLRQLGQNGIRHLSLDGWVPSDLRSAIPRRSNSRFAYNIPPATTTTTEPTATATAATTTTTTNSTSQTYAFSSSSQSTSTTPPFVHPASLPSSLLSTSAYSASLHSPPSWLDDPIISCPENVLLYHVIQFSILALTNLSACKQYDFCQNSFRDLFWRLSALVIPAMHLYYIIFKSRPYYPYNKSSSSSLHHHQHGIAPPPNTSFIQRNRQRQRRRRGLRGLTRFLDWVWPSYHLRKWNAVNILRRRRPLVNYYPTGGISNIAHHHHHHHHRHQHHYFYHNNTTLAQQTTQGNTTFYNFNRMHSFSNPPLYSTLDVSLLPLFCIYLSFQLALIPLMFLQPKIPLIIPAGIISILSPSFALSMISRSIRHNPTLSHIDTLTLTGIIVKLILEQLKTQFLIFVFQSWFDKMVVLPFENFTSIDDFLEQDVLASTILPSRMIVEALMDAKHLETFALFYRQNSSWNDYDDYLEDDFSFDDHLDSDYEELSRPMKFTDSLAKQLYNDHPDTLIRVWH